MLDTMITAVDDGFSHDGIVSIPETGLEDVGHRSGLAGPLRDSVNRVRMKGAAISRVTVGVFKQNGDHDGKPGTTSATQSRRTPKLPVCDETAMEKGCFSGIVPFNRGCLEPISVEDIRDSYPEQKKLNEKIVEEGWDMVSPVNARQEARSRKGHDSRGVAREA